MVRELAASAPVRTLAETVLGKICVAVKGTFFNKTQESNWKVAWHQDLTIVVRDRREVHGFGPWTVKAGIVHVQPRAETLSRILVLRLHLDESGEENGPLRVIPGSHRRGRFSAQEVAEWSRRSIITCTVPRGGVLLMRPLLLHASSACLVPKPRRVVHLEFAAHDLCRLNRNRHSHLFRMHRSTACPTSLPIPRAELVAATPRQRPGPPNSRSK
jgi:ectoine hydroxylase-related dioxygenase (phytanoyl-CoA dioxygenase family)